MSQKWICMVAGALVAVVGMVAFWTGKSAGDENVKIKIVESPRLFELRTYYCYPGRLEALHKRFSDHTVKLFEKHGMKNEMYWTPTDPKLMDHRRQPTNPGRRSRPIRNGSRSATPRRRTARLWRRWTGSI